MLTYDEIKDLCKHAGEVLAICPVNCKRCTAENCPITDKFTQSKDYNQKMCDLKQEENELEAERAQLERWSDYLEIILDDYRDLDAAYSENADLVKTTFADFAEALKNGANKVAEAKKRLKNDFTFINRFKL